MGISKTYDLNKLRIKISNPSQESPAFSKDPNEDLKDINLLCTFKSRQRAKIQIMAVSKTSDHIQIKIIMPNPSSPVKLAADWTLEIHIRESAAECEVGSRLDIEHSN